MLEPVLSAISRRTIFLTAPYGLFLSTQKKPRWSTVTLRATLRDIRRGTFQDHSPALFLPWHNLLSSGGGVVASDCGSGGIVEDFCSIGSSYLRMEALLTPPLFPHSSNSFFPFSFPSLPAPPLLHLICTLQLHIFHFSMLLSLFFSSSLLHHFIHVPFFTSDFTFLFPTAPLLEFPSIFFCFLICFPIICFRQPSVPSCFPSCFSLLSLFFG